MSDERYDALINQNQTQNLAAATCPVSLWDVDTNDNAHNLIADLLLPNVFADTDVRVNYAAAARIGPELC